MYEKIVKLFANLNFHCFVYNAMRLRETFFSYIMLESGRTKAQTLISRLSEA